jgi:Transport protein particle (TRAPP) component
VDKVSAELVTLTYGSMVVQLVKDFQGDYAEVNRQLDKMGYNIGLRLIEDFLAKAANVQLGTCMSFRETAEVVSKVRCSASCTCHWPSRSISERQRLICTDWIQNLPQHYAVSDELDQRQQAVLARV